jgi:hypothetical protein
MHSRNLHYRDTPQEIRNTGLERFEAVLRPLEDAGKRAAVHFQLPQGVRQHSRSYGRAGRDKRAQGNLVVNITRGNRAGRNLLGAGLGLRRRQPRGSRGDRPFSRQLL